MDRSTFHTKLRLTPRSLIIAALALALFDLISVLTGDSFLPGGPIDELAHLLTTLVVLWALGPKIYDRFLVPALIVSVAIDIDHIPGRLGYHFLEAHAPRPYTHSLLTILVVVGGAALWRARREPLLGVALGLLIHFWRDLADPGSSICLLWPLNYDTFHISHGSYVAGLAVCVAIDAYRCRRADQRRDRSHSARNGSLIDAIPSERAASSARSSA